MPFESPPADPVANRLVEENPRFLAAVVATKIVNYASIAAAGLAFLIVMMKIRNNEILPIELPLVMLLIGLMMAVPIVVLWFRGLIWYNFRTTVPNPSIIMAMFAISVALVMLSMMVSFAAYLPMVKTSAMISVVLWVLFLLTTSEFKAFTGLDIGNMFAVLILIFVFSYGAYATTNFVLDSEDPQTHAISITGKRYSESRDSDYYEVSFTPVPGIDDDDTEVTEYFYNKVEVNDTIYMKVHPGRWGNVWYELMLE